MRFFILFLIMPFLVFSKENPVSFYSYKRFPKDGQKIIASDGKVFISGTVSYVDGRIEFVPDTVNGFDILWWLPIDSIKLP